MARQQLARGTWTGFGPREDPFSVPNGMAENLRLIDDHLALYTLAPPLPAGSDMPQGAADGDGQIWDDGTYAVYGAGVWKTYPARHGIVAALADGSELYCNTGAGWWKIGDELFASLLERIGGADGADIVGFMQPGSGAVLLTALEKMRQEVDPRDFGAVGDGITDDSAAINAMQNNPYVTALKFSNGVYCISNITISKPWHMGPGVWIKYNGATITDFALKCVTNNTQHGNINIDCDSKELSLAFGIVGSGNTFKKISIKNMLWTQPLSAGAAAGVKINGVSNTIEEVFGYNLINEGDANTTNVSSPQLMCYGGGASLCHVEYIFGRNIRSCVVSVSDDVNSVGNIKGYSINDNGIYMAAGTLAVRSLMYHGSDEPVVSIGGGGQIGTIIVEQSGGDNAVVGINNAEEINIGEIYLRDAPVSAYIIRSRGSGGFSKHLRIGKIYGTFSGIAPIYLNQIDTLEALTIGEISITHRLMANSYTGSWCRFEAAQEIHFGRVNIKVIDNEDNTGGTLNCTLHPSLKYSEIDYFSVLLLKSDGTTSGRSFFGKNFLQSKLLLASGVMRGTNGDIGGRIEGPPFYGMVSDIVPAAGSWERGQVIWNKYAGINGPPGWICTQSGAPGVWHELAYILNT